MQNANRQLQYYANNKIISNNNSNKKKKIHGINSITKTEQISMQHEQHKQKYNKKGMQKANRKLQYYAKNKRN